MQINKPVEFPDTLDLRPYVAAEHGGSLPPSKLGKQHQQKTKVRALSRFGALPALISMHCHVSSAPVL